MGKWFRSQRGAHSIKRVRWLPSRDTLVVCLGVLVLAGGLTAAVLGVLASTTARHDLHDAEATLVSTEHRADLDQATAADGGNAVDAYIDVARTYAADTNTIVALLEQRASLEQDRAQTLLTGTANAYNTLVEELDRIEEEFNGRWPALVESAAKLEKAKAAIADIGRD